MDAGQARLHLEELDSRVLPSGFRVPPSPVGTHPLSLPGNPVVIGYHSIGNQTQPVQGSGLGSYVSSTPNKDTGTNYQFSGTVHLTGFANVNLGTFNLSGYANTVGNVNHGRANGQIVLSSPSGTITLGLIGRVEPGLSPLPHNLMFIVTATTGAFHHPGAQGTVQIELIPTSSTHGGLTLHFS